MKKLFLVLAAATLSFGAAYAQEANDEAAAQQAPVEQVVDAPAEEADAEEAELQGEPMHFALLKKFLEGGWGWMLLPLVCLILGMAIAVERILFLALSKINTKKFIARVEDILNTDGVEAAKEYCRNTRGPVASIFYQGLMRYDQGLESVEKAVVSYGSVKQGEMESGLSWISLCIALAPSLGFMGTVVGMIQAFDDIQAQATISPAVVAGGIKVALLTTMLGLIAAVILQIFFNYILAQIEAQVVKMEDSSITLIDMLTAYNKR
ncbi:MAG: MotA/TolQ/ExbB proton channel family protein [Alistipes sp.]|nr:MotA/TolQ/ExbB proton channel family protein [Alistipes sp.]